MYVGSQMLLDQSYVIAEGYIGPTCDVSRRWRFCI